MMFERLVTGHEAATGSESMESMAPNYTDMVSEQCNRSLVLLSLLLISHLACHIGQ